MTVNEPGRRVPVAGEYDVIVCGGGPAGVSAGLSAARNGAKTLIIESEGCLGGTWTAGQLCVILDAVGKGGIMEEITARLQAHDGHLPRSGRGKYTYDVEAMKYILDGLCAEVGVDVRLYTRVVAAVVHEREITAVITESYGGREAFIGKVFIDATGNGQFAAQAGCDYSVGHPQTSQTQPATVIGIISGAPSDEPGTMSTQDKLAFLELLESVGFVPTYRKPSLWRLPHPDLCCISVHHAYGIPCDDTAALSRATFEGRKQLNEAVRALRKLPEWKQARLVSTSAHIGIREGRRIAGRYQLTVNDIRSGARFDDGICLVRFGVDVHALTREEDEEVTSYSEGIAVKPYNVPLRSLIARDVDNLGLAGRCVSGDFYAHASYRVTTNAVAMGEAIGLASARAASSSVSLPEVDGIQIRQAMAAAGYEI
jgi:hypothetical protein